MGYRRKLQKLVQRNFQIILFFIKPHLAASSKDDFLKNIKTTFDELPNINLIEKDTDASYFLLKRKIIIGVVCLSVYTVSSSENESLAFRKLFRTVLGKA